MSSNDSDERLSIIDAVKTPLGLLTLALLIIEALMIGLVGTLSGSDRSFLLYSSVGIIVLVIFMVIFVAWYKPEALWGKREIIIKPLYADSLAGDIHLSLFATFTNFEKTFDREQAWVSLTDIIKYRAPGIPDEFYSFREALATGIQKRADITDNTRDRLNDTLGIVP